MATECAKKLIESYVASRGATSGMSGFTNYTGAANVPRALQDVFVDNPEAVVVDGDDDWYAPKLAHPKKVAAAAGVRVASTFHSGVSGLSKSGIVLLDDHVYNRFVQTFNKLRYDEDWTRRRAHKGFPSKDRPLRYTLRVYTMAGFRSMEFVSPGYQTP